MSIKIILPEGSDPKTTNGIIVKTESGHEITGITNIRFDLNPQEMITARIECVATVENLEGITAEFGHMEITFIEKELAKFGYKAVKIEEK